MIAIRYASSIPTKCPANTSYLGRFSDNTSPIFCLLDDRWKLSGVITHKGELVLVVERIISFVEGIILFVEPVEEIIPFVEEIIPSIEELYSRRERASSTVLSFPGLCRTLSLKRGKNSEERIYCVFILTKDVVVIEVCVAIWITALWSV